MNPARDQRLLQLLEEIRDGQRTQMERQQEALAMQREQLAVVRAQFERVERIQDRAENLQERSAQVIGVARKSLYVVLPILFALIAYVSWLIFR
jgi:hypothetical protein